MSSLQYNERNVLEKILGMRTGYVSDFSDKTFKEFVLEVTGIDIYTPTYEALGTSKANRLRMVWKIESDAVVAELVEALLNHAQFEKMDLSPDMSALEERLFAEAHKAVQRLKDESNGNVLLESPSEMPRSERPRSREKNSPKSIADYTDTELLEIIRRAENVTVPGSLFQRANTEWQIRHQQRMVEATKGSRPGVYFEVGGDMTNHGVIQTGPEASVGVAVAGNYSSSDKTTIIQGDASDRKEWYEKPMGILLLTVVAGLVVAGATFYLNWN